jgi:hypothetical protein
MRAMEDYVKTEGEWVESPTAEEVAQMYETAAMILPRDTTSSGGHKSRPTERSWRTVLNQLQSKVCGNRVFMCSCRSL